MYRHVLGYLPLRWQNNAVFLPEAGYFGVAIQAAVGIAGACFGGFGA
jgi:hypothetical protein